MKDLGRFCKILRKRSEEHSKAMGRIFDLPGQMASVLRQELDSMIRVIYLLSLDSRAERERMIQQTLSGKKWTVETKKGKWKTVTDKEMAEKAQDLQGWTLSVYRFGCAFIHLSGFHDYSDQNPFQILPKDEQTNILEHLRYYHGGPTTDSPNFEELAHYFPRVFEKIKDNLSCYIEQLKNEEGLEDEPS